jgi:hypothetical protein
MDHHCHWPSGSLKSLYLKLVWFELQKTGDKVACSVIRHLHDFRILKLHQSDEQKKGNKTKKKVCDIVLAQ